MAQSAVAQAQTQYQQDPQFPAPDVNFDFQEVSWLTVGPGGNLYLLQRGGFDVSIWNSAGEVLNQWWMDQLQYPHSLRIQVLPGGERRIWVTDMVPPSLQIPHGHCVKEFTEQSYLVGTIGACGGNLQGTGLDPVQFDKVTDIAFDSQGLRWISDGDVGGLNNRVLQLDANSNVLQVWSAPGNLPGSGPGQFNLPHALDIDGCDRVFIADTLNNRVQVIKTDGTFLQQLQCFGTDGVYGLRLATSNSTGVLQLATTSSPTKNPTGGTVRLFDVAPSCTAPLPVPGNCTTSAQWDIALPPAPITAMLHSIDMAPDGSVYIATLGGNLPPQRWIPVPSRTTNTPR
ncbi:MAG TPA: hypothetical protein VGO01_01490 [Bradyrhizobium sp.]|nr:hypothetical protein [Bradyrhizobium sp.]